MWPGELKTKLIGDDVTTADKKAKELQEYISGADGDVSKESEAFQRQAAQLRGSPVKLFIGGARITKDAMHSMDRHVCTKLVPAAGRFTVQDPQSVLFKLQA